MVSWYQSEKNKEASSYYLGLSKGKNSTVFLALSSFVGLLIQLVLVLGDVPERTIRGKVTGEEVKIKSKQTFSYI